MCGKKTYIIANNPNNLFTFEEKYKAMDSEPQTIITKLNIRVFTISKYTDLIKHKNDGWIKEQEEMKKPEMVSLNDWIKNLK